MLAVLIIVLCVHFLMKWNIFHFDAESTQHSLIRVSRVDKHEVFVDAWDVVEGSFRHIKPKQLVNFWAFIADHTFVIT